VLQPYRVVNETVRAYETGDARSWHLRGGIRLAVDLGSRRIGVARCDRDGLLASPLATIGRGHGDLDSLALLAASEGAIELIVGLPTGLSGKEGAAAARAREFAAALAARVAPLPVRLVDERFTTTIAHDALRQAGRGSRARRPVVDKAAATLILQGALDAERTTGSPAGELVGAPGAGG
jgi:putative Holliday junction resolvase